MPAIVRACRLVVSDLCSTIKDSRFVWLLAMCRGEVSTVVVQLSVCKADKGGREELNR